MSEYFSNPKSFGGRVKVQLDNVDNVDKLDINKLKIYCIV